MTLSKFAKFVFWFIGTLTVGALGNGFWELMRPALVWVSTGILDIATLGMVSLQDSIYVEIARGTYERAAEKILGIGLGLLTGLILGLIFTPRLIRKIKSTSVATVPLSRVSSVLSSMLTILVITLTVQNFRMVYVIRATNHMEQLQRVVAPYASEQQRLVFASRFASMHTREQYIALKSDLVKIANTNNIRVPDFDVY